MGLLPNHHPALKRAEAAHDVDGDTSFSSVTDWKHRGKNITLLLFHSGFVIEPFSSSS